MRRDWMNVGRSFSEGREAELVDVFAGLEWEPLSEGLTLPVMAGMALDAARSQLPLVRMSHVATSSGLAPCGLIAARCNYKNGQADVYILDHGSGCTPLAVDFYPADELEGFRLAVWELRKHYGRPKMKHGILEHVA